MDNNVDNSGAERINILENKELEHWSNKLGVSHQALKIAVIEVGSKIENIKEFFRTQKYRFDNSFF